MSSAMILPIEECVDPCLGGGKAAGLARLCAAGFAVPTGWCVTVSAYQAMLQSLGLDGEEAWRCLQAAAPDERRRRCHELQSLFREQPWPVDLQQAWTRYVEQQRLDPSRRWAVRSSATNEDGVGASAAGLYRTQLGQALIDVPASVAACWASLWDERVVAYSKRMGTVEEAPAMAVVIQPMIDAAAAGVAFSRHPLTVASDQVVIDAVAGLGEPLVAGTVMPDQYVVAWAAAGEGRVVRSVPARKPTALRLTAAGVNTVPLPEDRNMQASITPAQALALAGVVKQVEELFAGPVDVEWAFEAEKLWLLQARPARSPVPSSSVSHDRCEWSRANFKETLPEVPSPLGVAFLEEFMEDYVVRHYRNMGCVIPPGQSSVRVIEGRPYVNVTLLQSVMSQLGGDPRAVVEQMGGRLRGTVPSVELLPLWTRLKAGIAMEWKIRRAARRAPAWFTAIQQAANEALEGGLAQLPLSAVLKRLDRLGARLREGEMTFAIVAGVAQAFHVLGRLLPPVLGDEWRGLLNGALQGQGTVISAAQIQRLTAVADLARSNPQARDYFLTVPWDPAAFRERLRGTSCLDAFEEFLKEYGHRAIGESDVMTPRFAEDPSYLLGVIRTQVSAGPKAMGHGGLRGRDGLAEALAEIRRRLGARLDVWWAFRYWHGRLSRSLALREANRHALMYFADASRRLTLRLGAILTAEGRLSSPGDVFFLTTQELRRLEDEPNRDWRPVVASRKVARATQLQIRVPDFVGLDQAEPMEHLAEETDSSLIRGLSVSAGQAEGPVRHIRTGDDLLLVQSGDILVASVIDPGMAAVFGLASGLVAEMGGTLSHGVIIAREYGLPAIVNVPHATTLFRDGERIRLDATRGTIRRSIA